MGWPSSRSAKLSAASPSTGIPMLSSTTTRALMSRNSLASIGPTVTVAGVPAAWAGATAAANSTRSTSQLRRLITKPHGRRGGGRHQARLRGRAQEHQARPADLDNIVRGEDVLRDELSVH